LDKMAKWKISRTYPRPTTKRAWESNEGDYIYIDYLGRGNDSIPYKIYFNDRRIDSTGTMEKAMKIASMWRRKN